MYRSAPSKLKNQQPAASLPFLITCALIESLNRTFPLIRSQSTCPHVVTCIWESYAAALQIWLHPVRVVPVLLERPRTTR